MELIAYIIYQMASHSIIALMGSIFAGIALFSVTSIFFAGAAAARARDNGNRPSLRRRVLRIVLPFGALVLFLGTVVFGIFALINIIRPHLIDGYLIDSVGAKADATVLSIEETNNLHNKRTVMRHNVVYRTADGRNIENYFETWDFNIYPASNSVRYPQAGETFRVAYLPSFPHAFLILTEDESDYSTANKCRDLLGELDHQQKLAEFDPADRDYQRQLKEARAKAAAAGCLPEDRRSQPRSPGIIR